MIVDKLSEAILGIDTPKLASRQEWQAWHQNAKSARPIRYFIAETAIPEVTYFLKNLNLTYYLNNRFVSKSHILRTRQTKPGEYSDLSQRILDCLFDELVDFIEIEKAWALVCCDKDTMKEYKTPWYRRYFRIRAWRSPKAGLDHLKWEMEFEGSILQGESAKEQLALYNWWTIDRPNRQDTGDASGWTKLCNEGRWQEDTEEVKEALTKYRELEEAYEQEDQAMLHRLIDIRSSLWT